MHPAIKTLGSSYQETVPTLVCHLTYIITLYMLDEEIPEEI